MNLDEYQAAADTTAMHPNKGNNVFYPVLGLIGEFGEVTEAIITGKSTEDILKEHGDCIWYISTICTELKIKLTDVADSPEVDHPTHILGQIAEITKKLMRDDNSIISQRHVDLLKPLLAKMLFRIKTTIEMNDSTVEEVCDINIKKLADRKARNKIQGSGDNR